MVPHGNYNSCNINEHRGADMNITFSHVDWYRANVQTNYWFDVDGTKYGLVNKYGVLTLVDDGGYPIEDCNDFKGVKDQLTSLCEGVDWDSDKL